MNNLIQGLRIEGVLTRKNSVKAEVGPRTLLRAILKSEREMSRLTQRNSHVKALLAPYKSVHVHESEQISSWWAISNGHDLLWFKVLENGTDEQGEKEGPSEPPEFP